MKPNGRAAGPGPVDPGAAVVREDASDQAAADTDQTLADTDQTLSDEDQTASAVDQATTDTDQRASDHDQATADRDQATRSDLSAADQNAYDESRSERETASSERSGNRLLRARTAHARDAAAVERDRNAGARDRVGRARELRASRLPLPATEPEASLRRQLEELRTQAELDRARAAADRARAARDRANAARERARLEAELESAHVDQLTGAYHRELGKVALGREIARARRADGRFVLAFIDVDGLKAINDRDGHAAGDTLLQEVVRTIKGRLRSFDLIVRYGGDEFVCGLSGTDTKEARVRFDEIASTLEHDSRIGISVGLVGLEPGDTAALLTERADKAMLAIKALRHAGA